MTTSPRRSSTGATACATTVTTTGRSTRDEVDARRLTALIYREYLDSQYLVPKPDKLVAVDVNESAFTRRVPGTVIYARPGDTLCIHVKNGDVHRHSFHVHGLRYGIDSDGSWPFGTRSSDGRRSDEICPGQTWTYSFQVGDESQRRQRPLPGTGKGPLSCTFSRSGGRI